MRDLSDSLRLAQIQLSKKALLKIVLSCPGHDTLTFEKDRMIPTPIHTEEDDSHTLEISLNNNDGTLTGLNLEGYQCDIYWGVNHDGGDDYSGGQCAPLWVIAAQENTNPAENALYLSCVGIPNLLSGDEAADEWHYDAEYTGYAVNYTIKDFINGILNATLSPYSGLKSWDVDWDSEDDLIDDDTFFAAKRVVINQYDNRLDKVNQLLGLTKCVKRFGNDGHIHILNPTISGTTYDYEYSLEDADHKFYGRSKRTRIVIPNYVYVWAQETPVSELICGYAEDPSYAILPILRRVRYSFEDLVDNAQAQLVAEGILQHYQLDAESGQAIVPMNVSQEIWDYVNITGKFKSN
jgi:hypothetical protein